MYIEPRLNDHSDIWSANLKGRIIHCFGEIEENMAESIVAQLLYLESQDKDGFIIKKEICEFYYCYGIYGGCFAYIKDLATNEKFSIGKAL